MLLKDALRQVFPSVCAVQLFFGYSGLGADLKGRVLSHEGSPVARSRVEVWTLGGKALGASTSDADGRFGFDHLAVGVYRVRFKPPSDRSVGITADLVAVPRITALVVYLPKGEADLESLEPLHRISGEVTELKKPVSSAEVCLFGEAESFISGQERRRYAYCVVTDEQGWYTHSMPKGRYTLLVRVADQVRFSVEVSVPWGGDQTRHVDLLPPKNGE